MKMLQVIGSLDKSAGGPSRSVPQTCEHLSQLGIDIIILTRNSISPVSIPISKSLQVKFLSFKELIFFGRTISNQEVDLIHLQHIWDPYLHVMAWWARRKKIPYIVTPRGMLEPWILEQNSWKKKLGLFLYQSKDLRKARLIHATCELEKSNIRHLGFQNEIRIIPNGIDLKEIKKIKTNYGTKKMVFLSRIHPKKGIELLLSAWREIETEGWTLEIAGNGESQYIEQLKKAAYDLSNVQFLGPVFGEDKWNFLRSGDIMVLPTYSENFGIVVAEALAVGVPVITTKGTPWQDLNTQNCGWWIELSLPELKSSLSQGMKATTSQLTTMGINGIAMVKDKYDIKAVAKNMKKLYQQVLHKQ